NIEDTGLSAEEVQKLLLEEAGVAGIAGAAFGPGGKNYVRFSLVGARNLLEEALERMQRVSVHWRTAVSRWLLVFDFSRMAGSRSDTSKNKLLDSHCRCFASDA